LKNRRFLFTEGVIASARQTSRVAYALTDGMSRSGNAVHVTLAPGAQVDIPTFDRKFFANSSWGLCGKASIDRRRTSVERRTDPRESVTSGRSQNAIHARLASRDVTKQGASASD
jgi:FdhD protein